MSKVNSNCYGNAGRLLLNLDQDYVNAIAKQALFELLQSRTEMLQDEAEVDSISVMRSMLVNGLQNDACDYVKETIDELRNAVISAIIHMKIDVSITDLSFVNNAMCDVTVSATFDSNI